MAQPGIHIAALVSYKIYPAKMGGQKGIALFYRYLGKRLPVILLSTKNNEAPDTPDVQLLPVLGNSKWRYINPFLFFKLKNFLKKNSISHLILEHPYYGWLGMLLKWFTPTKIIVHSHNIEALRFKSTGRWWWGILWNYEKWTHRNAHFSFFIQDDDRNYAIKKFRLDPVKCATITYGFEMDQAPSPEEKKEARALLCSRHSIPADVTILLFNGTLDYKPNRNALDIILTKINDLLLAEKSFKYRILICGNKLPAEYHDLSDYRSKNIIYAGFVDDITVYFKGADTFINPVTDGGGIKTKVVEALGYDLAVVSTASGAIGIPQAITGGKLELIADEDWAGFAEKTIRMNAGTSIPQAYFEHFYWGNIAAKAATLIAG